MKVLIYFLVILSLLFSKELYAESLRSDLVEKILLEFRSDIEVKEGNICVFKENAKPFSKYVMLDCENLLVNILLPDFNLEVNVSRSLVDDLVRYADVIIKSLYSTELILKSEKEEDAIIVARVLVYLNRLDDLKEDVKIKPQIREFISNHYQEILPILTALKEEENVSKLIEIFHESRGEDDRPKEQVLQQTDKENTLRINNDEERSKTEKKNSRPSLSRAHLILGLALSISVVLGSLLIVVRKERTLSLMTKEERAELRELKLFFGVSPLASIRDLTKSYRLKVREVHPDLAQANSQGFLDLQNKYARIKELQNKFFEQRS